jgi:hypothetical protein
MMKLITLAALFIFGICSVHAQTNGIKGILIDDADKRPVRGASVSLMLRKDSAKVKKTRYPIQRVILVLQICHRIVL